MTDRPPLRCEQIDADLLAGPAGPEDARRLADHLAACPDCHALSRQLERDRVQLRGYLDGADWLPVANRVFAALPDHWTHASERNRPVARTLGPLERLSRPGEHPSHRVHGGSSPIATTLRAACLLIVGLSLGLASQQVWPHGDDGDQTIDATRMAATGAPDGALGAQPGSGDGTAPNGNSAYVPAPGNNLPLIVPDGTVGITASQNRETWRSVRHAVQDGLSPLLYPPVPPGTFDSVVIDTMSDDAFAVRYATEDMDILMAAGAPAAPTSEGASSYQATVRGTPATVRVTQTTVPGQGGLRLDGQASSALAPGSIVEVTWTETGLLRDPASGVTAATLPYRVTSAGLPVDVVMTFVDSLVPFGNGWDELREDLPTGTTIVTPGTMPDGFGAASLIDQSVSGGSDGIAISWIVAYRRTTGDAIDRIIFSAAPATDTLGPGPLTVAGQPATLSRNPATTDRPAEWTVTWQVGTTRYRAEFSGDGLTDAEIDRVLAGLTETTVTAPAAPATGHSPTAVMGRAA